MERAARARGSGDGCSAAQAGAGYDHPSNARLLVSVIVTVAVAVACAHATPSAGCSLPSAAGKWEGSCGALIEDEATTLSIAPAAAITTGVWRRDEQPSAVWAGTITVGEYPATPVEIEIYGDEGGAMRTPFGWFVVSRAKVTKDVMQLDVDTSHEAAPSGVDREIVQRARAILSSDAVWNRADDRECPAEATTWSIYCAMEKATIDIAGAFHHRRPALQVVREIVDERTADRPYDHRLMDYNNDPTTRLSDVYTLFDEAVARIDAATARHSAETPGSMQP